MKKKFGLVLVAMLSTGVVLAQTPGNPPALPPVPGGETATPPAATPPPPAPEPAPVTPAPLPADTTIAPPPAPEKPVEKPAAKPAAKPTKKTTKKAPAPKKTVEKKKSTTAKKKEEAAVPLPVNQPAVSKQDNVNVRGQAKINSEVVARLKKDQQVMVLEEITLKKPQTDEPAKWAKISMPEGTHVFVNNLFLDGNTVKPAKLNVRSGAGENYSVVGMLHKGDTVKPLGAKGDWTEIETPAGAYAFVAAHLLAPAPAAPPQIAAITPPPPSPAPVEPAPTLAAPPTEAPAVPPTETPTAPPAAIPQPPVVTAPPVEAPILPPTLVEAPKEPRIVQREGIVSGTVSIQAPSYFQLKSLDNGNVMDYLFSPDKSVVLKKFKGKRVFVSGEEGLDERWPNTPVLTIQNIQVVE